MHLLAWKGPPPPRSVVTELTERGVTLAAAGHSDAKLLVIAGEEPRAPAGPARWLWLPARAPSLDAARTATLAGALDVLSRDDDKLALRLVQALVEVARPQPEPTADPGFVAYSPAAKAILLRVEHAARTSMPVLVTGETGTGKEVVARMLHARSARAKRPFVAINCAAIPNDLIEAELFGYTKGAYTGAQRDQDGQLAHAEGGTVFLDEIDDTPFTLQVKLLRVLEDHVISRLGENVWRRIDFRIIAATNEDLRALIAERRFGADLFERLAIVHLQLPPLRERLEDLPHLAAHLLRRYYEEEPSAGPRRVQTIAPLALQALAAYPWPGNIRELRNVLFEALTDKTDGEVLRLSDLPRRVLVKGEARATLVPARELRARLQAGRFDLVTELEALEREAVRAALALEGGNAAAAARRLGRIGRGAAKDPGQTLRAMAKRLGLERPNEGPGRLRGRSTEG